MSELPETRLVNRIRKAILRQYPDAWVVKIHGSPYQESGIPDLLVCIGGHLFGLEVKDRKAGESEAHAYNRTTAQQQSHIDRINRAGGSAATILTPEQALAFLDSVLTMRHDV